MSLAEKALKLSKKAYKLSREAVKSNPNKYVVLLGYDNLWNKPDEDTILFYILTKDGKDTPVHLTETSYDSIINNNNCLGGKFQFTYDEAKKYKYRLNGSCLNYITIMNMGTFIKKYGFLDKDD